MLHSTAKEIDSVLVEDTPCTVLNMEFFDRLWKCGVVRESGQIVKCYDEVHGDFVISDELRKVRVKFFKMGEGLLFKC